MNVKGIQKLLSSVVLLVTLISFSGFSNANKSIQITKTELVIGNRSLDYSRAKTFNFLNNNLKKITHNQYIFFNFKSLLNTVNFNFSICFKTQKKVILQFIGLNSLLQQNLIAKTHLKDTSHILIK